MMIRPVVADLSHYTWDNGNKPDFEKAKVAGAVGVLYKASQGATYRDPTYAKSRKAAKAVGLLWGAYHFGTAADVKSQINNFFAAADPDNDTLLALDFEKNEKDPSNTISKNQAVEFLVTAQEKIGRPLTLYTGPFMYDVFGRTPAKEFAAYRVWWARYSETVDLHPTWKKYWLWQYTDGFHGQKPHDINGFGFCDCNTFDGTDAQLVATWLGEQLIA